MDLICCGVLTGGCVVQLPVVIEPAPDRSGFTARLGAPFELSASAPTAEEAHRALAVLLQRRLQEGMELRALTVPSAVNGTHGGWLPDDELTHDWLRAMQEYRAECDAADRARLDTTADQAETPS
jgi:hypothetical protein